MFYFIKKTQQNVACVVNTNMLANQGWYLFGNFKFKWTSW